MRGDGPRTMRLSEEAIAQVIAPYQANGLPRRMRATPAEQLTRARPAGDRPGGAGEPGTRAGAAEARADRIASPGAVQVLLRECRCPGRGRPRRRAARIPQRCRSGAVAFPTSFRLAYFLHRHLGIVRPLADRLAERVEMLLVTRLLIDRLLAFNDRRIWPRSWIRASQEFAGEVVRLAPSSRSTSLSTRCACSIPTTCGPGDPVSAAVGPAAGGEPIQGAVRRGADPARALRRSEAGRGVGARAARRARGWISASIRGGWSSGSTCCPGLDERQLDRWPSCCGRSSRCQASKSSARATVPMPATSSLPARSRCGCRRAHPAGQR